MKNYLFNYCALVADLLKNCKFSTNSTRVVVEEIELVAFCFDESVPARECAQLIVDRKNAVKKLIGQ